MWTPGTLVFKQGMDDPTLDLIVCVRETGFGPKGPKSSVTIMTHAGKLFQIDNVWMYEHWYTIVSVPEGCSPRLSVG